MFTARHELLQVKFSRQRGIDNIYRVEKCSEHPLYIKKKEHILRQRSFPASLTVFVKLNTNTYNMHTFQNSNVQQHTAVLRTRPETTQVVVIDYIRKTKQKKDKIEFPVH